MKIASFLGLGAIAALSIGALAVPASAHHSFAMFDAKKTSVMDGTVTEFQFTNPHSWLEVDVTATGAKQHWSLEMNNLVGLRRVGWRAKTLKPGDKVKVTMHPLRDGSSGGQLVSVTLPDGSFFDGQGIKPATGAAAATPPA
jgi:hypothetical protein